MARDLVKEAAWAKTRYIQIKFTIEKELGEKFNKYFDTKGIKKIDWFREVVKQVVDSEELVTVAEQPLSVDNNEEVVVCLMIMRNK